MTPLAKARELLTELNAFAITQPVPVDLPSRQYAQLGEPVVDCASVIVALTAMEPHPLTEVGCSPVQLGTFQLLIIRSCSWVVDNDSGITDVDSMTDVADTADTDGQLLWAFADQLDEFVSKEWSVGWALTDAGLGVSSLQLSTGID